jgi:hypothetical protein
MDKPVIFIDFDDTLTASPIAWRIAIAAFKQAGNRVVGITQRRDTDENNAAVNEWMQENNIDLHYFYTSLASKTDYIETKLGIKSYILCDNDPKAAVNGH